MRPCWLAVALVALLVAGCSSSSKREPKAAAGSAWIKDTVSVLDLFSPDADTAYYFAGYGAAANARTVIAGQVPSARYWSFTAYPAKVEVHDTGIAATGGRYTVTIAGSCASVTSTCLPVGGSPAGVVVMRIYVPSDGSGAQTGGVPLPVVSYEDADGRPTTLEQAAGTDEVSQELAGYAARDGGLPPALTATYPAAAPVPVPVVDPPPQAAPQGNGVFANPDAVYQRLAYSTARGDLVVSARAPTYQLSPTAPLAQVRYWSLCTDYRGGYTGACLRDQQVRLAGGRFTVVVAPACPVAGYANCLVAGPQALQLVLLYRNLLPAAGFTPFAGAYSLTGTYVARA
jgi:hypothetical protein